MRWRCSWQSEGIRHAQDGYISIEPKEAPTGDSGATKRNIRILLGGRRPRTLGSCLTTGPLTSLPETAANVGGREAREEKGKRGRAEKAKWQ
ncbi:hypothetical protein NDU88_003156 [Pleurodeles waltl]|uniref:Uncharacterized protein n=1 Tax=Pleurodeles waltl TaxID=8319 RepID=A0AAV7V0J1_PLEWA|nr:hypothetical protein NDU88_003156 [Pleurodeles waltl]